MVADRLVRRSLTSTLLHAMLVCVGATILLAGYQLSPAAGQENAHAATVISVKAGTPSELAYTLSRSSVPTWPAKASSETITFAVTNNGTRAHDFKVCTTPVKHAIANSCAGKATKLLRPGRSARLTVSFKRRGSYEYLSTLRGDAAGGMKGLVGVGVKLAASAPAPPGTTSVTTTTTTTSPGTSTNPSSLVGNANAGKPIFASAGCGSCHTLAAAGASSTVGPSLDALKPMQSVIVQYVTNGSSASPTPMPSYAATLTPTQIDDLAAYIYLVVHTIN